MLSTDLLISLTPAHSSTHSTPVDTLVGAGEVRTDTKIFTGEVIIVALAMARSCPDNIKFFRIYHILMVSFKHLTLRTGCSDQIPLTLDWRRCAAITVVVTISKLIIKLLTSTITYATNIFHTDITTKMMVINVITMVTVIGGFDQF